MVFSVGAVRVVMQVGFDFALVGLRIVAQLRVWAVTMVCLGHRLFAATAAQISRDSSKNLHPK